MTRLAVEDLAGSLALINRLGPDDEHVIITRDGRPAAALISLRRLHELLRLERAAEDIVDVRMAEEATREADEQGWLTLEEVKRKLGIETDHTSRPSPG